MAATDTVVVLVILTTPPGELILQQRDHNPTGADYLRGKVTFFGGHGEPGETPEAAISREVMEELELRLEPEALELLGVYRQRRVIHGDDNVVHVFRYLKPVDPRTLVVHEGLGYVLMGKCNDGLALSPFARQLVDWYFNASRAIEQYRVK